VLAKALAKLWFRASGPREVTHQRMNVPRMLPLDTGDFEKYIAQYSRTCGGCWN
jgi:hypothetical protein